MTDKTQRRASSVELRRHLCPLRTQRSHRITIKRRAGSETVTPETPISFI